MRWLCSVIQEQESGAHLPPYLQCNAGASFSSITELSPLPAPSTQIQVTAAGRVHCRVHDVSCLADLAPELSTLVRLRHQLNWYHKGCPPLLWCPYVTISAAHFLLMNSNILTWLSFFTSALEPVNRWPECSWPSSQCYSLIHAACEEALIRGARQWAEALGSVRAELGRLQGLLADYSIQSTPQAELSILLTTGRASPALQQFLCSHLGEPLLLLTHLDTGLCPTMLAAASIGT